MNFTEDEKKAIREISRMKAFTFYLDDVTKLECIKRLREKGLDTAKGTLSALIRVLLSIFAEMDDEQLLDTIVERVQDEYTFTTKRNKRSTM